ncbi:MAG: Spy/CpxP family protein refolding chaperone [Sulfuricella sp.]
MNKPKKILFASSIVAVALAVAAAPSLAEEAAMSNQQTMMKSQAKGGGTRAAKPCYGSGMGRMDGGYRHGMQQGMGGGYGPGMMGGGMGGSCSCPGMMMGQGMMGQGMMGQGMMGQGMMGQGMMGQGMMGQGMGGGMGRMAMLDLSDAQIDQVEKIQTEAMKRQRGLMRQMWDEQEKMSDLYDAEVRDPAAIGKAFSNISDLRRQALEVHIDAENKMAAVLTKEQRAQLRRGFGRKSMMGY